LATRYTIEYASGVFKDLKALSVDVRRRALEALEAVETILAENPYRGRPLAGAFKGLLKYRIGDCPIVYSVEKHRLVVFVLRIRHRKDVYRGLQ
jgi:mRNA interferase RelE/StbE